MTIAASVYIATSLDGFIAREDGSIDWLMQANATVPSDEDCGYAEFMSSVDVLIMGRNTYDQVASFEPWPYEGKRVVVLTRRPVDFRQGPGMLIEASSESADRLLSRLHAEGCKHAYIDGGKVIQSFMAAGLINKITITVIPMLLGSGRRLFGALPHDVNLSLVSQKAYKFGFVQTTYQASSLTA